MKTSPPSQTDPLSRILVVLVEPQHPGNVGAAARAMKNMGLSRLAVVAPPAFDVERARWMAPGCDDLLAAARYTATLEEALEGVHRAIASTARHRSTGLPVVEPRTVAKDVFEGPEDEVTAILFGREDFGLSKDDVARCDRILRIPTLEHASLNLGQAVLLTAHTLFEEARSRGLDASGRYVGGSWSTPKPTRDLSRPSRRDRRADLPALEPGAQELVRLLDRVGYTRGTAPEKVLTTARALLQQAGISLRQVDALRGMVRRVEWALDHPDQDPRRSRRENASDG